MSNNKTATTFNHAGFVTSNPHKGSIYLCHNNCITDNRCGFCGQGMTVDWPVAFFLEGDPGAPVCEGCALKKGFTASPLIWQHTKRLLAMAIQRGLTVPTDENAF